MIVKVFENTEAARCGLIQEGDRLIKVGEEDVREWEFQRMIGHIKAQAKVRLSLKSAAPAAF